MRTISVLSLTFLLAPAIAVAQIPSNAFKAPPVAAAPDKPRCLDCDGEVTGFPATFVEVSNRRVFTMSLPRSSKIKGGPNIDFDVNGAALNSRYDGALVITAGAPIVTLSGVVLPITVRVKDLTKFPVADSPTRCDQESPNYSRQDGWYQVRFNGISVQADGRKVSSEYTNVRLCITRPIEPPPSGCRLACSPGSCTHERRAVGASVVWVATCHCPKGYVESDIACDTVDACAKPTTCTDGAGDPPECENRPGGFRCTCPAGQTYSAIHGCVVKRSCASSPCPGAGQTCTDVGAGHVCSCPKGRKLSGTACVVASPCRDIACGPSATCRTTANDPAIPQGRARCDCLAPGTVLSGDKRSCADINECKIPSARSFCLGLGGRCVNVDRTSPDALTSGSLPLRSSGWGCALPSGSSLHPFAPSPDAYWNGRRWQ